MFRSYFDAVPRIDFYISTNISIVFRSKFRWLFRQYTKVFRWSFDNFSINVSMLFRLNTDFNSMIFRQLHQIPRPPFQKHSCIAACNDLLISPSRRAFILVLFRLLQPVINRLKCILFVDQHLFQCLDILQEERQKCNGHLISLTFRYACYRNSMLHYQVVYVSMYFW